MSEKRLDLHIDYLAHVHHGVRLPERHQEERLRLVRFEAFLLPELWQHLACRGVRVDRPEDDLGGGDVVGMVYVATAVAHGRIHREDDVGPVDPDLARDGSPHVDRGLEVAILEFEEYDVSHAQDLRRFALLRRTDVAQALARHIRVLRPRRTVRDHAVGEFNAGLRPLRDGTRHAELGVVWVRVDGHRPLDIQRLIEPHLLSVREGMIRRGDRATARVRTATARPTDGRVSSAGEMRRATGHAPGRINLIGEHTDYNDGLVMPIALRLGVTAEAVARNDQTVRLSTDAQVTPREASYELGAERRDGSWVDRARGVTATLARDGVGIGGFEAEISSDLPVGAGLGSSAAFAIALLRALSELFDLRLDDRTTVRIAHAAETEFAGARAGLLDQLASVYGHQSQALLIDMRDGGTRAMPLPASIELAVIDSGSRHEHATGGYNQRRAECEEACRHLGVTSLRDLDGRPLDAILERLPTPLDRRVRHVVTENERVREATQALAAADERRLGELLTATHRSLRDDYEVSIDELDRLVELADRAGARGSRLVGGGFGGSIIALTERGEGQVLAAEVLTAYAGGRLVAVVP